MADNGPASPNAAPASQPTKREEKLEPTQSQTEVRQPPPSANSADTRQKPAQPNGPPVSSGLMWIQVAVVLVNVVIAFFTYIAARAASKSATASEDSAHLNHEVYTMSQRPWAGAMPVVLVEPVKPGNPVHVKLTLLNTGHSPALNVELLASLTVTDTEADENTKFAPATTLGKGSRGLIFPGKERESVWSTDHIFSKEDIAAMANDKLFLYAAGSVEYDDAFGKHHTTDFCYMYRAEISPRLAMCPHGNRAN